ncbi:hypothetical protein GCK72_006446 [Caenorhabditis remanei]|uniref:Uncharacterized protein n=1 Tax=Caenorhabditis remanei TaxID=31234 RepID=A0A6A5HGS3_CAERE|nr:hypothetical protein GCK72_006446 [Caenorhabditis remanei]KAF1766489.1 hypothetical protein GCK72_006446 [Caenorhabditis remanei]
MSSSDVRKRQFDSYADADQTFAVTGTTAGIGVETAKSLALHGAHVVMLNRNVAESEKLKNKIKEEVADAKIDIIECDLNSLKSTKKAADEYIEKGWPIHCLILNAGVCGTASPKTSDGLESHFGINHLAHYLLIQKLLPTVRQSSPARIVILSSTANQRTAIDPSLPNEEKLKILCPEDPSESNWYRFYARSKMCNTLTAFKLHRDEHSNGISTYSVHPGALIRTSIFRDSWLAWFGSILISPFTKSISQGAATTLYCATHPEVANVSGKHWDSCWDDESKLDKALANDESLQDALWTHSDELLKKLL